MSKIHLAGAAVGLAMAAALAACNPTAPAKPAADTGKVADAVKADVAQLVVDLNAHDAVKAGSHDASDVVVMFNGQPNIIGAAADLANYKQFLVDPAFKVTKIDETVDVPASADMAVYRGTYSNDFTDSKTHKPTTTKANFLAGYKAQTDGSWKIEWYIVSGIGAPPAAAAPPPTKS